MCYRFFLWGLFLVLLASGLPVGRSVEGASGTDRAFSGWTTDSTSILETEFVRKTAGRGLSFLYNLRMDQAEARFSRIASRYPDHPIGPFLNGLRVWWTIRLDISDRSHDAAFHREMDEVLDRCEDILDGREGAVVFDALLFKAAAHGFKARLASYRNDWWTAILHGSRAIGPARKVAEQAPPGQTDYLFGKALYAYYADALEEEYPVTRGFMWLLPDGDRQLGLRLLEKTAKTGRYVQTEARYYLAKIYFLYEEDYTESKRYIRMLRRRYPGNSFFHVYEGRIEARWKDWKRVNRIFSTVLQRCRSNRRGYNTYFEVEAYYYLARERLANGHYKDALEYLDGLAQVQSGSNEEGRYLAERYLYTGMAYDALDERAEAVRSYRRVLELDSSPDVRQEARKYLKDPYSG